MNSSWSSKTETTTEDCIQVVVEELEPNEIDVSAQEIAIWSEGEEVTHSRWIG